MPRVAGVDDVYEPRLSGDGNFARLHRRCPGTAGRRLADLAPATCARPHRRSSARERARPTSRRSPPTGASSPSRRCASSRGGRACVVARPAHPHARRSPRPARGDGLASDAAAGRSRAQRRRTPASRSSRAAPRIAAARSTCTTWRPGRTELVSRADGAHGASADGTSSHPSISADGRYVTFTSDAWNLSAAQVQRGARDLRPRPPSAGDDAALERRRRQPLPRPDQGRVRRRQT